MRTALTLAAFAAGALAVPYNNNKRDMVTDYDVVYVTNVVTVTGGPENPAEATPAVHSNFHYGHGHGSQPSTIVEAIAVTTHLSLPPAQAPEAPPKAPVPPPAQPAVQAPEVQAAHVQAPATPAGSGLGAAPTDYQGICVYHHNLHRLNHSAPLVTWSDSLAASAQTIAQSCVYAHNTAVDGGGYGQNIAAGVEGNNVSAVITDLFYNSEEPNYSGYGGQPDMGTFELWGHFSQIVWKDTTQIGCYTQYCPGGLANVGGDVSPYFTVCNYASAGNFAGEYEENVLAPLGHPTANWNTGLPEGISLDFSADI